MSDDSQLKIKSLGGERSTDVKVLFIHGFGADKQSWAGNVASVFEFAECLALDLPGHGESIAVAGWCDLHDVAELIMQNTGSDQAVHLVGHSVGAAVAVLCAASRPLNVASLTLVAPLGLGQGVNRSFPDTFTALDNETDALALLQSLVYNRRLIAPALATMLLAQLNRTGARDSLKHFAAVVHESNNYLQAAFAKIARGDIRRQVFWGRQDTINPLRTDDQLSFGGDWHYLDDCGHLPHIEHRIFVNNKLCEFLKKQ